MGDGGWLAGCEGAVGGKMLPGPRFGGGSEGNFGLRELSARTFSSGVNACPQEMEAMAPNIRDAFPPADGCNQRVHLRPLLEWDPRGAHRVWRPRQAAYELDDDPAAFFKTLNMYLWKERDFLTVVGLRSRASNFDLRLYFVLRAVGLLKPHLPDISGYGYRDALDWVQRYW